MTCLAFYNVGILKFVRIRTHALLSTMFKLEVFSDGRVMNRNPHFFHILS